MSETVILCEGYHDRAFWKGWLEHLDCTDPGIKAGKSPRTKVYDPFKDLVAGGQFAYYSRSGHFIRVRPCGGKDFVLRAARLRLRERASKKLTRLVINVDPDTEQQPGAEATGLRIHNVQTIVQEFDREATLVDDEIALDGGSTRVSLIRWGAEDNAATAGVPSQQTLERLVCAALVAAFPSRGTNVQAWLNTRDQPPPSVKEFTWSFMAGWYADHGCEDFFTNLWRDPEIRGALESRLRASRAWQIAEALAR